MISCNGRRKWLEERKRTNEGVGCLCLGAYQHGEQDGCGGDEVGAGGGDLQSQQRWERTEGETRPRKNQASKQASKQARKEQASKRGIKQANKQESKQESTHE